jgi:two-component system cell cycle response regulator DivK
VRTILIIEDNPGHMRLAESLLGKAGYAVLQAQDAEAGLQLARERLPDLILMDVQLPGMDGIEATRALKADPRTGAIPVIVVTSYRGEHPATAARDAGASGYIAKPYHHTEFLAEIARVVDPRRVASGGDF